MTQDDSRTAMRENLQSIADEALQLPAHEGFRQKTGEDPQPMMQGNPQLLAKIEHALPRLVTMLQEERGEAGLWFPDDSQGQWDVFRALVNVSAAGAGLGGVPFVCRYAFLETTRWPIGGLSTLGDLADAERVDAEGVAVEEAGAEKAISERAATDGAAANGPHGVYLWRGDITTFAADCDRQRRQFGHDRAAACRGITASTTPSTPSPACSCAWNALGIMEAQGHPEPTGHGQGHACVQSAHRATWFTP